MALKLPHTVTILRAVTDDLYGNPRSSWDSPASSTQKAFHIMKSYASGTTHNLLMAADADIRLGDRAVIDGITYVVRDEPVRVRSPKRTVMTTVTVERLEV